MATTTTAARMTAEEFYEWVGWPENADGRFELERGEVVAMPPPGDLHGTICSWVAYLLWSFAVRRGRGRVNSNDTALVVERDPDTTRGADVMFFDASSPFEQVSRRYPHALPALVVEVLSPTDTWSRTNRRVLQYLAAGVPLVWVIDPDQRTVSVFRPDGELRRLLDETDTLTGNGVLPDFSCPVADLFRWPGPPQPPTP